jgi:magnesium transporter
MVLKIYKSVGGTGVPELQDSATPGCWVRLFHPTDEEVTFVSAMLSVPKEDITVLLDEEESARVDHEDGYTLVIVDTPYISSENTDESGLTAPRHAKYTTVPTGFLVMKDIIVTVSLVNNPLLQKFAEGGIRNFSTMKKTRFLLQFLYSNAGLFVQHLRQIDKKTIEIEDALKESTRNKELFELLKISTSLVYIANGLKGNEIVLEKLARFPSPELGMYDEDRDLLEDTIIENHQALEMAQTYSSTLSSTMDAFASIINNNVNGIMKIFTVATILLTIPTMIASFLGMNVPIPSPLNESPFAFSILVAGSLSISVILLWFLFRKRVI